MHIGDSMNATVKLVKELAAEYGPSGGEETVRKVIKRKIKPYVDQVKIDKFGNLLAHQKGKGPHIIVFSHMDEIGLMVKKVEDNGLIRFSPIGGIEPETLLAQQVHIVGEKGIVHGVISAEELQEGKTFETFPLIEDMYIDIGVNDAKKVKRMGIIIGNYVVPRRAFATLGTENIISGKAMDNRVGCAATILLAKKMKRRKRNITYAFTVQEEMGLYGAKTSAYELDVDFGIVVDATVSADFEDEGVALSKGPVLTYKDEEFIADHALMDKIEKLLKKKRIKYQREVSDIGTTDALAISLSKGGVSTLVVSIPVRNIHSTISIADTNDLEDVVKLLEAVVTEPPLVYS